MIDGEYVLTAKDLTDLKIFDDRIALGNYEIDIHNPAGEGTQHIFFNKNEYYSVPYRSLLPIGISNLLVGGRCISATHEAQAAVRIMPIACCTGQACGTAVSLSKMCGIELKNIDISKLQDMLRNDGAVLE